MNKSVTALAKELLQNGPDALEALHTHKFIDDESSHNDEEIERLYTEFSSELDRVQNELSKQYGSPSRTGGTDDEVIPLNGVFRFAVWDIDEQQLFVAAAHEDRGVPILLMLGTR